MDQMGFFDTTAPKQNDDVQNPAAKSNNNERAPFFDNADSLLQATMVQITTEEARSYVDSGERTIFELAESGDYFVIKSVFDIKDDKTYGYKIF